MKSLLALVVVLMGTSSFADTFNCKSDDFNPNKYEGQSLRVQTESDGTVKSIYKNRGSRVCDEKGAVEPQVVARNDGATVYTAEFNCDETNGRLVVYNHLITAGAQVRYDFSDAETGNSKVPLTCTELN